MPRMRRTSEPTNDLDQPPVVRVWVLQLLGQLGGHRDFIEKHCYTDDALAKALGLPDVDLEDSGNYDRARARAALGRLLEKAPRRKPEFDGLLARNLARFGEIMGLCELERSLLGLAIVLRTNQALQTAANCVGETTAIKAHQVFATLLRTSEQKVRAALSAQGVLRRSGILQVNTHPLHHLSHRLELISDSFVTAMTSEDCDPTTALRDTICDCPPSTLSVEDFDAIAPWVAALRAHLADALARRARGVNVLLYGPPGTGKTELAHLLASELGCRMFGVSSEDGDGDEISGRGRLRALRIAQNLVSAGHHLVLFDEMEDILPRLGPLGDGGVSKGWFNRTLEENPIPTLWISNSVTVMDNAFVRRFDLVVEMQAPPHPKRIAIIDKASGGALEREAVETLAQSHTLAPAVVTRAARVSEIAAPHMGVSRAQAMSMLIGATLKAQGYHEPPSRPSPVERWFDPDATTASADLRGLASTLARTRRGRLCFFGPPGAGKSVAAHWIAAELGVPCVVRSASDLLAPFVGMTERATAQMFAVAEEDPCVLLVEEVDSLFGSRDRAEQGWQVSQVDEMLVRLEAFDGIVIATTNRIAAIDKAALRRFDLKVEFGSLEASSATKLFRRLCERLALPAPTACEEAALARLGPLMHGDFATVARRHGLQPLADAAQVICALTAELALRQDERRQIGFHVAA